MMRFHLKQMEHKGDDTTFSPEGVYSFLSHFLEWTNKTFSQILAHGFKIGEPVKEILIEVSSTVNGKPVSDEVLEEICKNYPEYQGFSKTKLIQWFMDDLKKEKQVEDEQHRMR